MWERVHLVLKLINIHPTTKVGINFGDLAYQRHSLHLGLKRRR
jgi:hypothetical protein